MHKATQLLTDLPNKVYYAVIDAQYETPSWRKAQPKIETQIGRPLTWDEEIMISAHFSS